MKIIQISDTHLFAQDDSQIFGINSNLKFKEVLKKIITDEVRDADLVLLTGDISQDETVESYQYVTRELSLLNLPVYWIPGNHDNLEQLEAVFSQNDQFKRVSKLSLNDWNFVFLNTKLPEHDEGYLSPTELNLLQQEITNSPEHKKIAIIMHHHPGKVGTPLIDNYLLQNAKEFWSIVKNTSVELIICGHVHGDYCLKHEGITLESAPATCLQWIKGCKDLEIDARIGYKVYHFDQDGYSAQAKLW